jgi:predicted nucleic acid-binding protein
LTRSLEDIHLHLQLAKKGGADVFVTDDPDILSQRGALEHRYDLKIRTPAEMLREG